MAVVRTCEVRKTLATLNVRSDLE